MLRRFRGGAAVVMGALSPATRNAQVAMFQRGEVDYLVATDAIGMGLNMDVTHVAFAGLEKFDGRRDRRLTIAEMAQIAGRAGRHQKDGTFGTLGLGPDEGAGFSEEEITAIEEHRFRPLDSVYWRNADLDFTDVRALITQPRERRATTRCFAPRPKRSTSRSSSSSPRIRQSPPSAARRRAGCGRFAACPTSARSARCTMREWSAGSYSYIGEGGHIPHEWFAAEVARLDNMSGDIEALADRLAGIRSWAYIAHRADWLKEPAKWAERTREVEARLSDALHERLTQRFVDRRTAVLVRDIGARGADALPVTVAADGEVSVGPEPIGHLAGFEFRVDPSARLADKRLLLAAAERRLGDELDRRANALIEAPDQAFELIAEESGGLAVAWQDHVLARLSPGRSILEPALRTARALDRLSANSRAALRSRLEAVARRPNRPPLAAAQDARRCGDRSLDRTRRARAGGNARRCRRSASAQDRAQRHLAPGTVRPPSVAPARASASDRSTSSLPPAAEARRATLAGGAARRAHGAGDAGAARAGAATLGSEADPRGAALAYRRLGRTWIRIDLADRLASHARKVRSAGGGDPVDAELATPRPR